MCPTGPLLSIPATDHHVFSNSIMLSISAGILVLLVDRIFLFHMKQEFATINCHLNVPPIPDGTANGASAPRPCGAWSHIPSMTGYSKAGVKGLFRICNLLSSSPGILRTSTLDAEFSPIDWSRRTAAKQGNVRQ